MARVGHSSQLIVHGTMQELKDFGEHWGDPLHSLVIPGNNVHYLETDMMQLFDIHNNTQQHTTAQLSHSTHGHEGVKFDKGRDKDKDKDKDQSRALQSKLHLFEKQATTPQRHTDMDMKSESKQYEAGLERGIEIGMQFMLNHITKHMSSMSTDHGSMEGLKQEALQQFRSHSSSS